jgi:hypothetical protein
LHEPEASEARFLQLWEEQLARWCVDDLMPSGHEGALLQPLAATPRAAERLVRRAGLSDDHRQRKAAAILAGLLAPPVAGDLLDELFERESERGAAAPPEGLEPHYSQSVVEDLVLSASRWCRRPEQREPALALLRKVVERTLMGEYWSSAAYALATLCRHDTPDAPALLRQFAAFAEHAPPDHPVRPTLATERRFVDALRGGGDALGAVEDMLERQDALAAEVMFEPETEALVDRWLALARAIG